MAAFNRYDGPTGKLVQVAGCPVTNGLPTRMADSSFQRSCQRHQEQSEFCSMVCKGQKLPGGLELIDLAAIEAMDTREEEQMAKDRTGICNVCDKEKNLVTTYQKKTCSTCGFIVRSVKLTPELVIKEMQEVWGDKYFPKESPTDPENQYLIGELKRRCHASEDIILNVRLILGVDKTGEPLIECVSRISRELQELRESPFLSATLESTDNSRDAALLELALDCLSGKVKGIDAERIAALR